MRILFVSQEYPPVTVGGIGSYVASTASRLAQRGHEVHVLSCVSGQESSDTLAEGVHVHRRGRGPDVLAALASRSASAARLSTAAFVRREVARLPGAFDVVEAPEYMAESLLLSRGVPLVVTLHSPIGLVTRESGAVLGPDGRLADRLEARSARRAHVVTSPSALLADDLARSGWTGGRQVRIVPTAVDLEAWPLPDRPRPTAPRVLAVGRIEERKGALVLLDAAALLRAQIADLEVVLVGRAGPGEEGQAYLRRVRERAADLGAWCRLVDGVPRPELPAQYLQARVVVLASRFDNYPMTALEAMACGRPVVSTSSTGVAPVVRELDPGAVVAPDDPAALAAALLPYLRDVAYADQVGARARARVLALNEEAMTGRELAYRLAVERASRRSGAGVEARP